MLQNTLVAGHLNYRDWLAERFSRVKMWVDNLELKETV